MSTTEAAAERKSRISIVEVIILAIIVVGSATILLPALPASREEARIRTCQTNLRRFDLAIAMMQSQRPAQRIEAVRWPTEVLPHASQLFGSQPTSNTGFLLTEPRPQVLTCPSRMDDEQGAGVQIAHYELVLDDQKYQRWSGAKWQFRDRPIDLPPTEQSWWVGNMLTPEEAEEQLKTRPGPHKQARYNETNGEGDTTLLPYVKISATPTTVSPATVSPADDVPEPEAE